MVSFWSIGPIRGEFQPESFNETQEMNVTDQEPVGNVVALGFKSWKPREISISFMVNGAYRGEEKGELNRDDQMWVSPEGVWLKVREMVRPRFNNLPRPVDVNLTGWGIWGVSKKAIVVSASINRTHIDSDGQAQRATITMTLRELAMESGRDVEEAIAEFQEAEFAEPGPGGVAGAGGEEGA